MSLVEPHLKLQHSAPQRGPCQSHLRQESCSRCGQRGSPVAPSTEAGIAVDFIHTLGSILTLMVLAVILIFTAVVTYVTWHTLTPMVDRKRISRRSS